jgi:hypothetical protein
MDYASLERRAAINPSYTERTFSSDTSTIPWAVTNLAVG